MSHFTVMVIGPDPEAQLEPYSEHLVVDPYYEPVSDDDQDRFLQWVRERDFKANGMNFDEAYERYGYDWNGGRWEYDENGELVERCTYNPHSKWDWHQLGGRWSGYFKLKSDPLVSRVGEPGVFDNEPRYDADQALKGDIDFDGMREAEAQRAGEYYDEVWRVLGDSAQIQDHVAWPKVRDDLFPNDIEAARKFYNTQPLVQKAYESRLVDPFTHVEEFFITRDEYVDKRRKSCIAPFALLVDGEWYEKGRMGWFGMAANEEDDLRWEEKVTNMLDALPDTTLISLYDCHI